MDIPARIKELREQKGYSTNKLAKLAGIGQSTLREIEIGQKQPTVYTIDKICVALGITLAEFFVEQAPEMSPEIRRICEKAKRLTPDKLKVLESVLDTWVDNDLPKDSQ